VKLAKTTIDILNGGLSEPFEMDFSDYIPVTPFTLTVKFENP
jgi:hypothetical protein